MQDDQFRTGSTAIFDRQWKDLGPDRRSRYSEGDVLRYAEYTLYLVHQLIESLIGPGQDWMAEIGCGRGDTGLYFARRGRKVLLLDLSLHALRIARQNFESRGLAARVVQGEMSRLPLQQGALDSVLSLGVLEHFADPGPVIREMAALLKPGGAFCATVVYTRSLNLQRVVDLAYHLPGILLKNLVLRADPKAAGTLLLKYLGLHESEVYENALRQKDYLARMKEAGLTGVRVLPFTTIPSLRLPPAWERRYIRLVRCLLNWRSKVTGAPPIQAALSGRQEYLLFGRRGESV